MWAFFLTVASLFAAVILANCAIPQTRTINTTFVTDKPIGQLKLGSNMSLVCNVKETPDFRNGNSIRFYVRQPPVMAWALIVSGVSPSTRHKVVELDQKVPTELSYMLSIENFQPADFGVYSCNVTPPTTADILGTFSADISLSINTSSSTGSASNSAVCSASSLTAATVIALVLWSCI